MLDGAVDEEAVEAAVALPAAEVAESGTALGDPEDALAKAKKHLEETIGLWDWVDDVEFVGLSWVEFR